MTLNGDSSPFADFQKIPLNGTYSGTTSQSYPMSFIVSADKIQSVTYKITVNGYYCSGTFTVTMNYTNGLDIINNAFNDNSGPQTFGGLFRRTGSGDGCYVDPYAGRLIGFCWLGRGLFWNGGVCLHRVCGYHGLCDVQ